MTKGKTMRNYACMDYLEPSAGLPKLAEVLYCANSRCGHARLRSTNVACQKNAQGQPVCDPCADADEAAKLEKLWAEPVADLVAEPATVLKPKRARSKPIKGGQGIASKRICYQRDLDATKRVADSPGLTAKMLGEITGISHHTCKIRLYRLFQKGWLLREREGDNFTWGYRYSVSDKGLEIIKGEEK